jgi:hypothetical protein
LDNSGTLLVSATLSSLAIILMLLVARAYIVFLIEIGKNIEEQLR